MKVYVLVVCCVLSAILSCVVAADCKSDKWFGPKCVYRCHCANDVDCDKVTGKCPGKCDSQYTGPACQYVVSTLSGPSWLVDGRDETCSPGGTGPVIVKLDRPYYLTWIRVVVRNRASIDLLDIKYAWGENKTFSSLITKTARVNSNTLDILCLTRSTLTVTHLQFSGPPVRVMCSVYISKGRNVALKQTSWQSSTYKKSYATLAVDGNFDLKNRKHFFETACSHTVPYPKKKEPGWWRILFSPSVHILALDLYNRECCAWRLKGFTLSAYKTGSCILYTYTDKSSKAKKVYKIIPPFKISEAVGSLIITTAHKRNILSLCQVVISGEAACPSGKFGLRCERDCNCVGDTACFVHSGGCPFGCKPGFTGEDCWTSITCPHGMFGLRCERDCNCVGDAACLKPTGNCPSGCKPGYTGEDCWTPICQQKNWFGNDAQCLSKCHCPDEAVCDTFSGKCPGPCADGWFGPACQYVISSFSQGPSWLTDRNDSTCNAGPKGPFIVVLDRAHPLTWLRVVVRDPAYTDQIYIEYATGNSKEFLSSNKSKTARVTTTTQDIWYPTDEIVTRLRFSGPAATVLCSVYISRGRNVAVKQPVKQSSGQPVRSTAKYAVDGNVTGGVCSHIPANKTEKGRFTVTFSPHVYIVGVDLYNTQEQKVCCLDHLAGFSYKAFHTEGRELYTYREKSLKGKHMYVTVPDPKISDAVESLTITSGHQSNVLTLCEVVVHGEFACPLGTFGFKCERDCNCVGETPCFVHSGGCPSGCKPGYTGEDCWTPICQRRNWFGTDGCRYKCHCAVGADCNKVSGKCPGPCADGRFGPSCQYVSVKLASPLMIKNDKGCNLKPHNDTIRVGLDKPIPLTWLRIGFRYAGFFLTQPAYCTSTNIHLLYQISKSTRFVNCTHIRVAQVDDTTLDVHCPVFDLVTSVTLKGPCAQVLCSLHISGGRNVALQQSARQSSRRGEWYAKQAVDGEEFAGVPSTICSHTELGRTEPGWWELTFSPSVYIIGVDIYNRPKTLEKHQAGFYWRAFDAESRELYTDRETSFEAQSIYETTPNPVISKAVKVITITASNEENILALCEVIAHGESTCPPGLFGLKCDRDCNCAGNENCFVHSGGCPSGCKPGYSGEDCWTPVCQKESWFGTTGCTNKCHCAAGADCNKISGKCPGRCEDGWFGPACQYVPVNQYSSPQAGMEKTACNVHPSNHSLMVGLVKSIPLTWLSIGFLHAANCDSSKTTLQYQLYKSDQFVNCTDMQVAWVDNTTLDVSCPEFNLVRSVHLEGPCIQAACFVHVSGGRNVALKQLAEQSTTFESWMEIYFSHRTEGPWRAQNAVDGEEEICSHTELYQREPGWWTLTFLLPVHIVEVDLYNRPDCCQERLTGFTLTAYQGMDKMLYSYTDSSPKVMDYYKTSTDLNISEPVKSIMIKTGHHDNVLTLCEVVVLGEVSCPSGKFGLMCERDCNCVGGAPCFVHSGGCPSGCKPGYTGEDCWTTICQQKNWFGIHSCMYKCHCALGVDCDKLSGKCPGLCENGWFGPSCQYEAACPHGKFGVKCEHDCNCAGDAACYVLSGSCPSGCKTGYTGDDCWTPKCQQKNRYGIDKKCGSKCHCANGAECDRVSGKCPGPCADGWFGPTCQYEASCSRGKFGLKCERDCNCAGGTACIAHTGGCPFGCEPGYTGEDCWTPNCKRDNWFGTDRCTNMCHCENGQICDKVSGKCPGLCAVGWLGSACQYEAACPIGKYGPKCEKDCNCADGGACFVNTGGCPFGSASNKTTNPLEESACPPGKFGLRCERDCNCVGDAACHVHSGGCPSGCKPGYIGEDCSIQLACPLRKFGLECERDCNCVKNETCNVITGGCPSGCKPGYAGEDCWTKLVCPPGKFGLKCGRDCNCVRNEICNAITGGCPSGCKPGYTGEDCWKSN